MRIRGMDEDTGKASDDLKGMAKSIKGLTGVSIFTDDTQQTYKSTYEILKEISKVYDNLSDKKQAEVLELLAGKRQGNVVASMLTNFQSAEKALEVQANSAGGALREQDTYMDSISAHANKFKETLVGIGQNVVDTTEVKKTFDILTGLLNVLDSVVSKLGTLPVLLSTISGILSGMGKSAGRLYAPFLKVA